MKKNGSGSSLRKILAAGLAVFMLSSVVLYGGVTVSAEGKPTKEKAVVCLTGEGTSEISDYSIARGTVTNRLYAGARTVAYVDSYGGELSGDSVAEETYAALNQKFAVDKGNESVLIELDPPVTVEGAVIIEDNIVSVDNTNSDFDAAVNQLLTSVARGCVAFCYDHPEVYWVRNHTANYRFGAVQTEEGTFAAQIVSVTVNMLESYDGAYSELGTVMSGIGVAEGRIQEGQNRYETLKNIHDYVCDHSTYNYPASTQNTASEAHTAAPLFNGTGTFVCEGYSKSFKVLCDRFGIPCALVQGTGITSSGGGPHMWNFVKMEDGNWYGVDVTWDDSGDNTDYNQYQWFLKGADEFETDHLANGIVTDNNGVQLVYPVLTGDNYDPDSATEPVASEPVASEPVASEPVASEPVASEPVASEPVASEPVASEPVASEPVASEPVASEPVVSQPVTSGSSSDDTPSDEQPKNISVTLDDPNNGFVKSASLPDTAKAKAGNDDVALTKIRVIVTKLDDAKKKALTDGIKKVNGNIDFDKALVQAYDIQLVDDKGNTVTITEGKLRVCLAFPAGQTKKYSSYYYYLYHQKTEGGVERIQTVSYNAQGVWFEHDKFSPFELVSLQKDEPSPGTGETILYTVLAIVLLGLAAGAIALVVIRGRREEDGENAEEKPDEGGEE